MDSSERTMTNGRSGRTASWVAAAVAVILMIGSGSTAYSNLSSSIVQIQTKELATQRQLDKLDEYDARLSDDVDGIGDRMIRSESEQASIKRTQERIEFTMSEMLKQMKQLNDTLIKMDR